MEKSELIKGNNYEWRGCIVQFTGIITKRGLVVITPMNEKTDQKFITYSEIDEMYDSEHVQGSFGLPEHSFLKFWKPVIKKQVKWK